MILSVCNFSEPCSFPLLFGACIHALLFNGYLHTILLLSNSLQHLKHLPRGITIICSVYSYTYVPRIWKGDVHAFAATLRFLFVQFILAPRPFRRGLSRYMWTSLSRPMSFLVIPNAAHRSWSTAWAKVPNSTTLTQFTFHVFRSRVQSAAFINPLDISQGCYP